MNLSQVVQGFFVVRRTRLAPITQTNYRYCFDKLLAYFGPDAPFTKTTTDDIRHFFDYLRTAGIAERSVHNNFAICSLARPDL